MDCGVDALVAKDRRFDTHPGGSMENNNWLDREAYPFRSRFLELDAGRMHYIDEGQGDAIVLVHGTPTWSFLYRNLIKELSKNHRCIAMDHIGFGLSDKPAGWTYRPQDHARNVQALIDHLDLQHFTLIVHDLGGPIGISYAIEHPEHIRRLILFNTFMWAMRDDFAIPPIGTLMGGPIGKFLYTRLNISARMFLPLVYGDKSKLTPEIHRQYINPFPHHQDRYGMWVFAREMGGSADWYESRWSQRDRIKDVPTLILWGMKDPAFTPKYLARWQTLFTRAQTVTFPNTGHFVQEEEPSAALAAITAFLARGIPEPHGYVM